MVRNSTSFGDIQIAPLNGLFDLRSPSGTMPIQNFRLVLNASMNEQGKRCRRPQFRKFGAASPRGFNNQDLHDRLEGGYYCGGGNDDCACTETPDCLLITGFDPDVFVEACDGGEVSGNLPTWDGKMQRTSDCSWGFAFYTWSFKGLSDEALDLAALVSLKSCPPVGIKTYQLSILARNEQGGSIKIWEGESNYVPVGEYLRTGGCDNTASFSLESCEVCVEPVVTASPPSGSVVATGTYISLFSTEGAQIFFTTDGSTPTNNSELYTAPFQISDNTTIKARAYTPSCISDVYTFTYTIDDNFIFEFTCDDEDQSGVFEEFDPNSSADYNWRLRFTLPEIDVTRVEIYETNAQGVWVTGQAWATNSPVQPEELGGSDFSIYPIVIFDGGAKVADEYRDTLITGYAAGAHEWMMYGQPFIPLVGYFRIVFYYNEAGEDKVIYAVIPHECYYYY